MAYNSTIQNKCKNNCGRSPIMGLQGFCWQCVPDEILEARNTKKKESIKKSNAAKRDKAKINKFSVKTVIRPKQRPPINKVSKRRMEELKIYSVLKKDFLKDNPICKCGRNGCKRKSVDVHHMKGRLNGMLNVVEFWLPVARICHSWIENNPLEAKELGLSLSRLSQS